MTHRRRLRNCDYSAPGSYLITAVTFRRHRLLGCVNGPGTIRPTVAGRAVVEAWHRIPRHRPWVRLGAFVLMPDHWHGILAWAAVPPGREGHLSVIVGGMKAEATRLARVAAGIGENEPLWMRSYDVRFLNSARAVESAERYILENPSKVR